MDDATSRDLLTVMDDFLASLSHLAPLFAETSLQTLFARVESTNRVQFLQQLKDEFGVALLPDRQKLANVRKAASRAAKGWSDDMAANILTRQYSAARCSLNVRNGQSAACAALVPRRCECKGLALVLHWQPDAHALASSVTFTSRSMAAWSSTRCMNSASFARNGAILGRIGDRGDGECPS